MLNIIGILFKISIKLKKKTYQQNHLFIIFEKLLLWPFRLTSHEGRNFVFCNSF
jgi:hypothetical protein